MAIPAKINNPTYDSLKVLIAPLDWGLGHATRCIPIIKELLNQRCEVIVAATGAQRALLQEEFASLTFVDIPGYRIKYGKNRTITVLKLIVLVPKFLIRINKERAWLAGFAARQELDLVISDNRYGLCLPGIFCVFITHQLAIRTPFGWWADRLVQWMNYRLIRRFSRCWVPDVPGPEALAGGLSNPGRMPAIDIRYIGWLSRMRAVVGERTEPGTGWPGVPRTGAPGVDVLVLLSGPEPQRTVLERRVLQEAGGLGRRLALVRGLPGGGPVAESVDPMVTIFDHLPAAELEALIAGAGLVIARSGYSTVMDLARMGKRAVLVPTPGQTEQEYLGRHLAAKGWAICMRQREFSLREVVNLPWTGAGWPLAGGKLTEELESVLRQSRPSALG